MMKKKILIVVHTNTWFTEMERVTDLVRGSTNFIPLVHFAYSYPTIDKDIKKLKLKGVGYTTSVKEITFKAPTSFVSKLVWVANNYLERIFKFRKIWRYFLNFMNPVIAPFVGIFRSLEDIKYYQKLIRDLDISAVVMGGDLVGYNTPEIVKAAYKANKACVIVPSTMSDGTEQAEAYFFDSNFSADKLLNRFAGWLWPKWKKYHKGKWLVRVPALQIFNRQLLKLDPPLPWISSSTRADAIAVESKAMRDYYKRCGIEEKWLKETGSVANDSMFHILKNKTILRNELISELKLSSDKKIILTALPPDSLYMKGGRPACEFKDYRKLTEFWIQTLAKVKNFNIVVSLHPSVDIEEFRYLESENVRISKKSIVELIPLCDVFVASVSSTIRWAITCGKPVINYDVYVYKYTDFNHVKGVILLEKSEEYEMALAKLDDFSSGYLEFIQKEIQSESSHWGQLDGLEGQRILNLFAEEIDKKKK